MRDFVRENEKRAGALARKAAKAETELRHREKLFKRSAVAQQRGAFKQLQRQAKAEARTAAQSRATLRKIGALVRSAPAKRTRYQRRVVSGLARQSQRGEALSIRRVTHKPLPTSLPGLRQRAVERLVSIYGDHPNFERSTVEANIRNLAQFPRILEHIIRADEGELSSIASIQTTDPPENIEQLRARLHAIDANYDELRTFNPARNQEFADSSLEETVSSEPVSEARFPATWENTGNCARPGLWTGHLVEIRQPFELLMR